MKAEDTLLTNLSCSEHEVILLPNHQVAFRYSSALGPFCLFRDGGRQECLGAPLQALSPMGLWPPNLLHGGRVQGPHAPYLASHQCYSRLLSQNHLFPLIL